MRTDGRTYSDLRKINFTENFVKNAKGSCLVEFGDTRVLVCATYEDNIPK